MPIELYFGNRLEDLSEKLAEGMNGTATDPDQVFCPPVVIVPNQNLAKWLQLILARRESIVMNTAFQYLEDGLWDMLGALDHRGETPLRLDSATMKLVVLSVLQDADPASSELAPMIRYLSGPGDQPPENRAARLFQVSEKLTHLFQEYMFHRPEMIDAWMEGRTFDDPMEICQSHLYRRVFSRLDAYNRGSDRPLVSLGDYARTVLSRCDAPGVLSNRRVHVFGLSQISGFHLDLIGRLSPHVTIAVYALNPSREFWEDLRTPGEKRWIRRQAASLRPRPDEVEQGELDGEVRQALLSAWGKPGRESVRMLCALTDYDFSACYAPDKAPSGLLQTVQNNILTLEQGRVEAQDRSLQIMACPGIYREVETVYNSILYNLEQDPSLLLTDIAVLVSDMAAYKPVLDAVFNRSPRVITYNLVDSNARMESAYAQGVLAVLGLASGRFSRREVFELAANPCFMSHWGIDADDLRVWASWADALGIFHAFDESDKLRRGYMFSERYTFKQGLRRLRLGRLMALPGARGGADLFAHVNGLVPYGDIHTAERGRVEAFCVVVETLHRAVSRLKAASGGTVPWAEVVVPVLDSLLGVPEDLRGEAAVRRSLIEAYAGLSFYEGLSSSAVMDLDLFREFTASHLGGIPGGVGDYLTSGVTMSALQPMRPIPFRIIYVLGMGEGQFPGRADTSSLDLRLGRRRIGDITTPERNSYLFLEILLAAREKFYLSYVARDLQKDRVIEPCSVVNQLRRYVEQEVLPEGLSFSVCAVPLKGGSDRYRAPGAISEFCDVLVNYHASDRVADLRSAGLWDRFISRAAPRDREAMARLNPDFSMVPVQSGRADAAPVSITLRQLRKFLEDPVRQGLRYHLGIHDETVATDSTLEEDEPFYSVFPVDYHLKTGTLERWVDDCCARTEPFPEDIFERLYEHSGLKSQVPEGDFALPDKAALGDAVRRSMAALTPVIEMFNRAPERYLALAMGEAAAPPPSAGDGPQVRHLDAVTLDVDTPRTGRVTVTISGRLPRVFKDEEGRWHVLVITGSEATTRQKKKHAAIPVLFFMLCRLGAPGPVCEDASPLTLHVLFGDTVETWVFELDPERSRRYLNDLIADYLGQTVPSRLPLAVVEAHLPRDAKKFDDPDLIETFNMKCRGSLAESRDFLSILARAVPPDDPFALAERRFHPFFPAFDAIRAARGEKADTDTKEAPQ